MALEDEVAALRARVTGTEESLRLLRDADRLQSRPLSATRPANTDAIGWNATTKKWEPQIVQHHLAIVADDGTHDHGWDGGAAGTGAIAMAIHSMRVSTGATNGGTARYNTNDSEVGFTRGTAADVLDWTRSVALGFRFTVTNSTTNGLARISVGKTSGDGVGALGRKGIGIQVSELALAGQVHDGSSLTDTSTLLTLVADDIYDVYMVSDGAGNVEWFSNDVSIGKSAGGPAVEGTVNEIRIYAEVDNGADDATQRMTVHEIWVADLG